MPSSHGRSWRDRDEGREGVPVDLALRGRSWAWLVELRRHLRVAVQVVDGGLDPVLAPGEGPAASALAAAIASRAAPLRVAVASAMDTRAPHAVVIDHLYVQCAALASGHGVVGALVVAREQPTPGPDPRARAEIETIATALARSAEAHLAAPAVSEVDDLDRIGALDRLLAEAGEGRTEAEMVSAIAEALAVWYDVDLRGYLDTGAGAYHLEVSLPGADLSRAPSRVLVSSGPDGDGLVPLSLDEAERFGLAGQADAGAIGIGRGRGSWLLVLSGRLDARTAARIEIGVGLLAQWMALRTAEAVARLTAAMTRDLFDREAPPEDAARRALDRLEAEIGGATVGLGITASTGVPLVRLGNRPASAPGDAVDGLVIARREPGAGGVALALASSRDPFTARDCRLAAAAADLLDAWSRRVLRVPGAGERRQTPSNTDQVLERLVSDAVARGEPVGAIVLSLPAGAVTSEFTQTWLSRLRGSLRVTDIAGVLGEGELGVLLPGISHDRITIVAARLEQTSMMFTEELGAGGRKLSVGIAGRVPGAAGGRPLIEEAREAVVSSEQGN